MVKSAYGISFWVWKWFWPHKSLENVRETLGKPNVITLCHLPEAPLLSRWTRLPFLPCPAPLGLLSALVGLWVGERQQQPCLSAAQSHSVAFPLAPMLVHVPLDPASELKSYSFSEFHTLLPEASEASPGRVFSLFILRQKTQRKDIQTKGSMLLESSGGT